MMRMIPVVLLVAAAIAVLIWQGEQRGPFFVSGFIEADEIRVGSRVGGRVKTVPAEEGQVVAPGDLLVALEPFNLREQLAGAQAELAAQRAAHDQLKAGYRSEEVAEARARRDNARATLDQAVAGPRPLEIRRLEDAVAVADAEAKYAQADFVRRERLFQSSQASEEEFDDARRRLAVTTARLAQAQNELALAREGTRAEEIAAARALLAASEASVARLEQGYRTEEIAQAAARVQAAEAAAAAVEQQLVELEIKSPCACTVEAIDLEPGDLVAPNAPVISLIDHDALWVRAYLPENRLDVQVGRSVHVRVDAFPNRTFAGVVTVVARQAEFTPANVQTPEERIKQMFRIKVELREGRELLRPGMAADVFLEPPQ